MSEGGDGVKSSAWQRPQAERRLRENHGITLIMWTRNKRKVGKKIGETPLAKVRVGKFCLLVRVLSFVTTSIINM